MSIPTLLAPLFIVTANALVKHPTGDARAWVGLAAEAFVTYLAMACGLMLFSVLRLNAWQRAHPWAPPSQKEGMDHYLS
jgi:hypothetical protein